MNKLLLKTVNYNNNKINIYNVEFKDNIKKININKRIIVLHGTVSGSVESVYNWWINDKKDGIGVPFVIEKNGDIYIFGELNDLFYHAGSKFVDISKLSIGIEFINWVTVEKRNSNFYNQYGKILEYDNVLKLSKPFKGIEYFEKLTDQQINSGKYLINELCSKCNIDKKDLRKINISDIRKNKLSGITSHASFNESRFDFPDEITNKLFE